MMHYRNFDLFKKYLEGDVVDEADKEDTYELTSMGLARIGFTTIDDATKETAMLTPLGMDIYKREKILRNPIKKFFYSLANSTY